MAEGVALPPFAPTPHSIAAAEALHAALGLTPPVQARPPAGDGTTDVLGSGTRVTSAPPASGPTGIPTPGTRTGSPGPAAPGADPIEDPIEDPRSAQVTAPPNWFVGGVPEQPSSWSIPGSGTSGAAGPPSRDRRGPRRLRRVPPVRGSPARARPARGSPARGLPARGPSEATRRHRRTARRAPRRPTAAPSRTACSASPTRRSTSGRHRHRSVRRRPRSRRPRPRRTATGGPVPSCHPKRCRGCSR